MQKKNIIPRAKGMLRWPTAIGNKYVLYKILDGIMSNNVNINDENANNRTILASFAAFSKNPHEYVNLIMDYMGCINKDEIRNLNYHLLKSGEYYMAKVVDEEVMISD